MSELRDEKPPETIGDAAIELRSAGALPQGAKIRAYDPWQDRWTTLAAKDGRVILPPFSRSIVLRAERGRRIVSNQ